jgi:hypothetical protein
MVGDQRRHRHPRGHHVSNRDEAKAKAAGEIAEALKNRDAGRVNSASRALDAKHPGAAEELIAEVLAEAGRGR